MGNKNGTPVLTEANIKSLSQTSGLSEEEVSDILYFACLRLKYVKYVWEMGGARLQNAGAMCTLPALTIPLD